MLSYRSGRELTRKPRPTWKNTCRESSPRASGCTCARDLPIFSGIGSRSQADHAPGTVGRLDRGDELHHADAVLQGAGWICIASDNIQEVLYLLGEHLIAFPRLRHDEFLPLLSRRLIEPRAASQQVAHQAAAGAPDR